MLQTGDCTDCALLCVASDPHYKSSCSKFLHHNEFRIADIAQSKTSYSGQKVVTRLELETVT